MKYCLPIIKNNKQQILQALKTKGYDYYEIWLDYIKDLDDKFIAEIAKKYEKKLIFLFRRQNLEKIKLTLERRQEIISLLSNCNVLLDLDFLTQYEELEILRQYPKMKLILSYHNYKETPKIDYLKNLINKMKKYHPDIFKVATFCQKEIDGLNLLGFLVKLKEEKLKYIILGMGENGLIARIFGALWGNEFNFTPIVPEGKSAEGQLTKRQLENILKEVNINGRE